MFFDVLGLTYHSPITIARITYAPHTDKHGLIPPPGLPQPPALSPHQVARRSAPNTRCVCRVIAYIGARALEPSRRRRRLAGRGSAASAVGVSLSGLLKARAASIAG